MMGRPRTLVAISAWISCALLAVACTVDGRSLDGMRLPATCRQVVLSTGWNVLSTEGEIQRFARSDGGWRAVGAPIAVRYGAAGLAWGVGHHGLNRLTATPTKTDCDGRSVMGIFDLGPAFGYSAAPPDDVELAYRHATERDFFVRDAESPDYNRWCTIPASASLDPRSRWRVYESMLRGDEYELGIMIGNNTIALERGRGCATFLHVWAGPDRNTDGGVGMARSGLLELMRWLDPNAAPLFVQGLRWELHRLHYAR
ncbi:MAG: hypothetical protein NXI31_21805 [bacterium]|nr:hypothetical protein [bacterium]